MDRSKAVPANPSCRGWWGLERSLVHPLKAALEDLRSSPSKDMKKSKVKPQRFNSQPNPPANTMQVLLPLHVFAKNIGWHTESVRRACRQGRIAAIKLGKGWRVPASVAEEITRNGIPSK
jgi:hypothetical protein